MSFRSLPKSSKIYWKPRESNKLAKPGETRDCRIPLSLPISVNRSKFEERHLAQGFHNIKIWPSASSCYLMLPPLQSKFFVIFDLTHFKKESKASNRSRKRAGNVQPQRLVPPKTKTGPSGLAPNDAIHSAKTKPSAPVPPVTLVGGFLCHGGAPESPWVSRRRWSSITWMIWGHPHDWIKISSWVGEFQRWKWYSWVRTAFPFWIDIPTWNPN